MRQKKKKTPVKKKVPPKKKKGVIKKRTLTKAQAKKLFPGDLVERSQDVYTDLAKRYLITMLEGKPVSYTPAELLEKAVGYFSYCSDNPLVEEKVFGTGMRMTVNHIRAMSMMGLCVYACMHRDTFDKYKKDKRYSDVCTFIEHTIYMQKFEGAAADLLNHAIIARDLGLVDKTSLVDKNGDAITGFNYIVPTKPQQEESDDEL